MNKFSGRVRSDPLFWGDICLKHVNYVRNFVLNDINILNQCHYMPCHDPDRPYVKWWFSSSDGCSLKAFNQVLSEKTRTI
jgi:hypothetical protein